MHSLITESTDSRTISKKRVKNVVVLYSFLQNFDEFRHHLFTDCPYLILFTFNIKPRIGKILAGFVLCCFFVRFYLAYIWYELHGMICFSATGNATCVHTSPKPLKFSQNFS